MYIVHLKTNDYSSEPYTPKISPVVLTFVLVCMVHLRFLSGGTDGDLSVKPVRSEYNEVYIYV